MVSRECRLLCVGWFTVLLCIGLALWFGRSLDGARYAGLAWLLVATAVTSSALAFAAWMADRKLRRHDPGAIARWLDNIDVSGEQRPRPEVDTSPQDAPLLSAAEALVLRIHRYRDKLLIRHQRVQRLLRNVTDVLYHVDGNGRLTWVTETVTEMLGYTPAELEGRPFAELLADAGTDLPLLTLSPQLFRHPTRVYRQDGTIAWLLISSRCINDPNGHPIGSEGVCRDGTRLIETQNELNKEKERAQVTLASIGDGVIATDAEGCVDYVNPRAEQMLGVAAAEAHGMHLDTLCHLVDSDRDRPVTGLVEECIAAGVTREWDNNLALAERAPNTKAHTVKVTISPIRDHSAEIIGTVIVLHDVTRLQQITRDMTYQANHDLLTGLPNRRAFEKLLARYQRQARAGGVEHAFCYLDLDQFKLVNDTCGHDAGDEMLRQLTAQISSRLRADDAIVRLGGDEFGIVMSGHSLTEAEAKAESLRSEIDGFRFHWDDNLFRLGASIGVVSIDSNAVSATELLRRADNACYLAKEKGRNQVHVYHRDSDETLTRHSEMQRVQQISEALDNERFVLFAQIMQPLGNAPDTGLGVEMLLRLRDTEDAIRQPQNFLLTAERYNIASRIDRWVLPRALSLIAQSGHGFDAIEHYSINISGQSITDEQFVGFAYDLIQSSNVDPRRLVFEITETAAVTNTKRAGELIRSLRALGCRFSLDDFGGGLSTFTYLKNLPSDFIKIDGNLVHRILKEPIERSIVEAINRVGQSMGLKTVAEHVESQALLEAIERIGVDYAQGYHIAYPVPFADLPTVLGASKKAAKLKT